MIINYELKSILFGYGEKLNILEPITLAEELKMKATNLIESYK